ncbi:hypothetical protein N3K66_001737 [Trichothecium roseum]|uniref:Uncharacterized protein n=1 Tax=Trichothecium roseum TaxID=47278 RepID=A0ACC0V987_9HYPO|nr:hypothetical protein N3K66_001737 [Trichothecium roseum]
MVTTPLTLVEIQVEPDNGGFQRNTSPSGQRRITKVLRGQDNVSVSRSCREARGVCAARCQLALYLGDGKDALGTVMRNNESMAARTRHVVFAHTPFPTQLVPRLSGVFPNVRSVVLLHVPDPETLERRFNQAALVYGKGNLRPKGADVIARRILDNRSSSAVGLSEADARSRLKADIEAEEFMTHWTAVGGHLIRVKSIYADQMVLQWNIEIDVRGRSLGLSGEA